MTREEAIKGLEGLARNFGGYKPNEEMFDMAIEALKAEPCEDTISRKHLLSEIDELMQSPWFNNGKDDDMFTHYGYVERKEAVEVVRDLCVKKEPPVTPKQGTGKWMKTGQSFINPNRFRNYCCSECGWELDEHIRIEPHYCPNCGAKMRG